LKATVPLHLPRLLARDQQDLPIVQSEVYAQAWARDVANAGNVLGRYLDDSTRPVLKLVSRILPIFCPPPNVGSGSREEALGHVFLPATDEQDQIAECLYHEALHQYLFHLEHCVDLFDASTPSESRFYSPWRSDPRPLRMTLHGAFVFAGVAEFYLWREAEVELGINARECHRRAFHRTKQARRALEIVERHGRPTRAGRLVIGSIEATLDAISLLVRPHTEDKREVETLIAEHEARFAAYER
jgi:HEXXH motif-containing protein